MVYDTILYHEDREKRLDAICCFVNRKKVAATASEKRLITWSIIIEMPWSVHYNVPVSKCRGAQEMRAEEKQWT
jgi:hypothetical protein